MLRKYGKKWYIMFRGLDGKLKTRSLKTEDKEEAAKRHADYMRNLRSARSAQVLARDFPGVVQLAPVLPELPGHRRGGIRCGSVHFRSVRCQRTTGRSGQSSATASVANMLTL